MRRIAIYSAITAVASSKPTEFGKEVELTRETDGSFLLDESHDQLLDVLNLTTGGSTIQLQYMSPAQADADDSCWRTKDDWSSPASHFVWSEKDPRSIRIFGRVDAGSKLLCYVSVLPSYQDVSEGKQLQVRDTLFDAILDAAMDRCCQRRRPYSQDALTYAQRHAAHMQLVITMHERHNPKAENNAA